MASFIPLSCQPGQPWDALAALLRDPPRDFASFQYAYERFLSILYPTAKIPPQPIHAFSEFLRNNCITELLVACRDIAQYFDFLKVKKNVY